MLFLLFRCLGCDLSASQWQIPNLWHQNQGCDLSGDATYPRVYTVCHRFMANKIYYSVRATGMCPRSRISVHNAASLPVISFACVLILFCSLFHYWINSQKFTPRSNKRLLSKRLPLRRIRTAMKCKKWKNNTVHSYTILVY